ncbi:hypothetical protein QNI16_34350 [Cytophagaceae bacterium YF14B1]|uniref:Uncharacterized protein n=1 Tax=Xanthocytophaga flava TaxID=3048013 RepID=A0AAE3QY62_9BACT|nr:hypothetical protein [Xanthocytophaga flavus]MDJ1485623.1 hypothetical protein [Xanthocytophaga flavus]
MRTKYTVRWVSPVRVAEKDKGTVAGSVVPATTTVLARVGVALLGE